MRILFLLIFFSAGIINAKEINGAFGYTFGDIHTEKQKQNAKIPYKIFQECILYTTYETQKIYKITAEYETDSETEAEKEANFLEKAITQKYNIKTRNKRISIVNGRKNQTWQYEKGNKKITIRSYKSKKRYIITIEYIDKILEEENQKEEKKVNTSGL